VPVVAVIVLPRYSLDLEQYHKWEFGTRKR
jgi:hypothetical protein